MADRLTRKQVAELRKQGADDPSKHAQIASRHEFWMNRRIGTPGYDEHRRMMHIHRNLAAIAEATTDESQP